jgi:hypothetical protein
MISVVYRCPVTGRKVQGWVPEDVSASPDGKTYVSIACIACGKPHLVNPSTGSVLVAAKD